MFSCTIYISKLFNLEYIVNSLNFKIMFSPTNILTTDTVYWSMSSCDTPLYWWRNINTGFHSGSYYYVGYGLPGELDVFMMVLCTHIPTNCMAKNTQKNFYSLRRWQALWNFHKLLRSPFYSEDSPLINWTRFHGKRERKQLLIAP